MTAFVLAALLIAFLAAAPGSASAEGPSLEVDARPTGNEPTELGPLDSCVSVDPGERFQIDVIIRDVKDLLAWELYLGYDPAVVEVEENDVHMFQESNPGSSVFDVSERLPDSDGLFRLAAADTSDPPRPDSGSGVLARLTLKTLAPGQSELTIASRDLDGDGEPDLGPFLRNDAAEIIGDENGDTFFDGPITNAEVRVGEFCPGQALEGGQNAPVEGIGDGGVSAGIIAAAVAGGIALLIAVGGLSTFFFRRRARA
ncbi:MAG: cohesin domain-containing protein [Dehalococcoidia bacterium]